MIFLRRILLIPALFVAVVIAGAQNLISNGGFESGDFSSWTRVADGFCGVLAGYGQGGSTYGLAMNGQVGSTTDWQTVSQTFADTPGASYSFSYWAYTPDPRDELLEVQFNGATLFSGNLTNTSYQQFSFNVTGTGSDTILIGATGGDLTVVDNVAVAVPEPATIAILGLAILAFKKQRS